MNTSNQRASKRAPTDQAVMCCLIGCDRPATKLIYSHSWAHDNFTHACDAHVDDLKIRDDDVVEDLLPS